MADRFAPLVDFFSIGTNDLTQYALAVDRQHPELAAQADSLHPAVLNLIDATVRGAQEAGRVTGGGWVGVCGGLAGDPLGARILTGLGVDELSMSAQDVAPVKAALRGESRTAMPVSYTHLDVYKRQDLKNIRYIVQGKQVVEVWKAIKPLAHKAAEIAVEIAKKPAKPLELSLIHI